MISDLSMRRGPLFTHPLKRKQKEQVWLPQLSLAGYSLSQPPWLLLSRDDNLKLFYLCVSLFVIY